MPLQRSNANGYIRVTDWASWRFAIDDLTKDTKEWTKEGETRADVNREVRFIEEQTKKKYLKGHDSFTNHQSLKSYEKKK